MAATEQELARRMAAKRFNACLSVAADTWNTLVLAVLIAAIVAPIVETGETSAALTPLNGIVAMRCSVLHLLSYLLVRLSRVE